MQTLRPQVGWRPKYKAPPSLANVGEFVPPLFAIPFPPSYDTDILNLISVKDGWSIEIEDVKK
jgi:hypothetical protein